MCHEVFEVFPHMLEVLHGSSFTTGVLTPKLTHLWRVVELVQMIHPYDDGLSHVPQFVWPDHARVFWVAVIIFGKLQVQL